MRIGYKSLNDIFFILASVTVLIFCNASGSSAASTEVTLSVSPSALSRGETLHFTLMNNSSGIVSVLDCGNYWAIFNSDHDRVDSRLTCQSAALRNIKPGKNMTGSWNQNGGHSMAPGIYVLEVYVGVGGEARKLKASFEIK